MKARLLVLCWHNVLPTWGMPVAQDPSRPGFGAQIRFLRRIARVLPLTSALSELERGRGSPVPTVALTFDDGYLDNLEVAAPVLEAVGLPATFFLVPGFLSGDVVAWWERLGRAIHSTSADRVEWQGQRHGLGTAAQRSKSFASLCDRLKGCTFAEREAAVDAICEQLELTDDTPVRRLFLDWDGARQLVERGFEVASHSMRHAILSREDPAAQRADLLGAQRSLEQRLSVETSVLAYPNGRPVDYDAATVDALEAAGHRFGLTTRSGVNVPGTPTAELRRVVITPETGPRELARIVRDHSTQRRNGRDERGSTGDR